MSGREVQKIMVLPFFLWYTKQNGKLGVLAHLSEKCKKTAKQEVVYEQTNRSSGGSSQCWQIHTV